jgi:hypothetical protein
LNISILTISPKPDSDVGFNSTTIDLDEYVENIGGELFWGEGGIRFSESCHDIRLEKTFLLASCPRGRDDSEFVQAKLNLDDHIGFIADRTCFEAVALDPAFTELVSSANWMNFAVIMQPDIRSFLRNTAFQNTIMDAARRTVGEVMHQMMEEMTRAVETAVKRIGAESEGYIQSEMDTLAKKATKTAAYTGLGQVTMMDLEQRLALNRFAPYIAAAPVSEEMESEFH